MPESERWLTAKEMALYVGKPMSWIYDNNYRIPHTRIGREYRYRISEVDRWMEVSRGGTPLKYLREVA